MSGSSDHIFDAVLRRTEEEAQGLSLRQWLVLTGVGAVAITLLWASTAIPAASVWRAVVTALGTGLLVSAVFSFFQRVVTARADQRAQVRYLAAFADALVGEIKREVTSLRRDVATNEFPSTPTPDPHFNEVLMRDVQGTPYYWFRGYSARFLAARLRRGGSPSCQVHVILPDPLVIDSINPRLSYVSRLENEAAPIEEKMREKILDELKIGLVGLFLARHQVGSIELVLTRTPGLDRVELVREGIWISLFSGEGKREMFPRTLRYGNDSTLYEIYTSECTQARESPHNRRMEINRNTTEEQFRGMYENVTGEPLDREAWERRCKEFAEFEAEFSSVIEGRGTRDVRIR